MIFKELNYNNDTKIIIELIEKSQGAKQVIKVNKWSLDCYDVDLKLEISKEKSMNIIEEFIFKIALLDSKEKITPYFISEMLGIDELLIEKILAELIKAGNFEKNLKVTEEGLKQFQKGSVLTKGKYYQTSLLIEKKFGEIFPKTVIPDNSFKVKEINLTNKNIDEVIGRSSTYKQLDIEMKSTGVIVNKDAINQYLSNIEKIKTNKSKKINFLECWVYDLLENRLSCQVWNLWYCQELQPRFKMNQEISEYFNKLGLENNQIKEMQEELEKEEEFYLYNEMGSKNQFEERHRYEEKYIKSIKDNNNNNSLKIIRGLKIKEEFDECIKTAKKYLFIQSPWISKEVIDNKFLNNLKECVKKGCKIFITWGISNNRNTETRIPSEDLLKSLEKIKDKKGEYGIFIKWIGNHHNKEIIVDDDIHLAGSFNWLSYRGDYLPRGESVYKSNNKNSIHEAKAYLESKFFEAICLDEDLSDFNIRKNIKAISNLKTIEEKLNEYLKKLVELIDQEKTYLVPENKEKLDHLYNFLKQDKILDDITLEKLFQKTNLKKKNKFKKIYSNLK